MEIVELIGVDSKSKVQRTSFNGPRAKSRGGPRAKSRGGPARKLCDYQDITATANIDVAHLAKLTDINPRTIRTLLLGLNYLINEVQESEDISKIRVQYLGDIVYNSSTNTLPHWDWYTFVDESPPAIG